MFRGDGLEEECGLIATSRSIRHTSQIVASKPSGLRSRSSLVLLACLWLRRLGTGIFKVACSPSLASIHSAALPLPRHCRSVVLAQTAGRSVVLESLQVLLRGLPDTWRHNYWYAQRWPEKACVAAFTVPRSADLALAYISASLPWTPIQQMCCKPAAVARVRFGKFVLTMNLPLWSGLLHLLKAGSSGDHLDRSTAVCAA